MTSVVRAVVLALLLTLAAVPAAQGQELVVYSSLPKQGEYAAIARDLVRGIELALERAGRPGPRRPGRPPAPARPAQRRRDRAGCSAAPRRRPVLRWDHRDRRPGPV